MAATRPVTWHQLFGRNSPDFFRWVTKQWVLRSRQLQKASVSQCCFRRAVVQLHIPTALMLHEPTERPGATGQSWPKAGRRLRGLLPPAWQGHPAPSLQPLIHIPAPKAQLWERIKGEAPTPPHAPRTLRRWRACRKRGSSNPSLMAGFENQMGFYSQSASLRSWVSQWYRRGS